MIDTKKRAVFFDRDGVILKAIVMDGKPRPAHSIAEYKALSGMMPGAKKAVEAVKKVGFLAILMSNQPDIGYGVISKEEWQWIQDQTKDIPFDDVFICFHRRDDDCTCMKPKTGMFLDAAKKWDINLSRSFKVGDTAQDMAAAKSAGCIGILLNAPYNADVPSDIRIASLAGLPSALL